MAALADWALRTLGEEGSSFASEPRTADDAVRVDKQGVLYLHVLPDADGYQTQYECRDCPMWIADTEQCTIHAEDVHAAAHGSCGFFVPGPPTSTAAGAVPHGNVTPDQSGYAENPHGVGFSCKRCFHYVLKLDDAGGLDELGGCNIVDFDSPGDDPGMIHPHACCAAWDMDPERGEWSNERFASTPIEAEGIVTE